MPEKDLNSVTVILLHIKLVHMYLLFVMVGFPGLIFFKDLINRLRSILNLFLFVFFGTGGGTRRTVTTCESKVDFRLRISLLSSVTRFLHTLKLIIDRDGKQNRHGPLTNRLFTDGSNVIVDKMPNR